MMNDRGRTGYAGNLSRNAVTIAEVLGASGYSTYMCGKWHLTPGHDKARLADKGNWPLQRGFDRFYGTIIGAGSFYDPVSLCRGNTYITPENDTEYQPETFYYTDAISDQAVRYIREHNADANHATSKNATERTVAANRIQDPPRQSRTPRIAANSASREFSSAQTTARPPGLAPAWKVVKSIIRCAGVASKLPTWL